MAENSQQQWLVEIAATTNLLVETVSNYRQGDDALSDSLDDFGADQGSILYRNVLDWDALPPGTASYLLKTGGVGANPSWAAIFSLLAAGTGIAISGDATATIALASIADDKLLANVSGGATAPTATGLTQPGAGLTITGDSGTSAFVFALANDLLALEGLGSTGIAVRTGSDAWAQRTIIAPAAGITVTDGSGAAGNPTLVLADDLAALEAQTGTGLVARTASNTYAQRTITPPAAGIGVSNGDGVSGNPTISLANDLAAVEGIAGTGIAVRTATDTWTSRTITGTADKITLTDGNGVSGNPTITIAATYAGQTSIVTLGTVTTGTWNAGSVASSTNGSGVYPASTTTAGWAITGNFGGTGDVDFWNTIDGETAGFRHYQKTGASSAELISQLYHSGGYSEIDFYSGGSVKASFGGSTTEGLAGTFANIPFNLYANSVNTVSLPAGGGIQVKGTTSGSVHVKVPAVAGSNTLTLPAGTTDFSATGGANQVVQQASAGAAFTVGQLTYANIGSGTTSATATGLTIADGVLSGDTDLPGSGHINSSGWLGIGGTPSAQVHIQGSVSAAAWTNNGIAFRQASETFTDTSSSGAVGVNYVNRFGLPTLAASSATTYGLAATVVIQGPPAAGTNVAITEAYALRLLAGRLLVDGTTGSSLLDQIYDHDAICTTQTDRTSTTTFTSVTGLATITVAAGKTYIIEGWLTVTAGAAGGIKLLIDSPNGATATTFTTTFLAYDGITLAANTTQTTYGSNNLAYTGAVTDVLIQGAIIVNAGGNLRLRVGQNVSDATTTSIKVGSRLGIRRIN